MPRFLVFFIVVGFAGLLFLVSLPLLFTTAIAREQVRFHDCQTHVRYDCQPSLLWVLQGWADTIQKDAIVTSTTATSSTEATTSTPSLATIEALEMVATSSTASSTPLLTKFQSVQLVRNGEAFRVKPGTTAKVHVEVQDATAVTIRPSTASDKIVTLKKISPGVFEGTVTIPATLPVTMEMILKNTEDIWTAYNLHVASNQ